MEHIGDIAVNRNTQYWTYIINNKSWDKMLNYIQDTEAPYIMSFKKADVLEGDVICVYTKGIACTGFIAIIQAHKNITENKDKKIKIFKDNIANKFCVKIRVFTLLQKAFTLKNVSVYFEEDPYYTSIGSFRSKYIKGDLMFIKIPGSIGKNMVKGLYELSDNYEETSIREESEKKDKKENEKQKQKNNKKKEVVCVVKKNNNVSEDYEYSAEDFDIIENTSDSEYDLVECVSFEKNDAVTPMIPILFDPCGSFRWPDECNDNKDFIKEFKKHYTKCKECECTNNNSKDIHVCLIKCVIEFEMACGGDEEFEKLFNAYHCASEYNTYEYNDDFIKLYIVDNICHDYNKSIIIEWGIKSGKFTKAHVKESKRKATR